jgi:hypothetical protein
MKPETISLITSVLALLGVLGVGWLTYKGSDRASRRTAEIQKDANATSMFTALTQEQRAELLSAKQDARSARDDADRARAAAEECNDAAQRLEDKFHDLMGYTVTLQMSLQRVGQPVPAPPASLRPPL